MLIGFFRKNQDDANVRGGLQKYVISIRAKPIPTE